MRIETPHIQTQLVEDHRPLAELIRFPVDRLPEEFEAAYYPLGEFNIPEIGKTAHAKRFHVGPQGLRASGGMKGKTYPSEVAEEYDGFMHSAAMGPKLGALGETDDKGAKTIITVDINRVPYELRDRVTKTVMRRVAEGMFSAGLADYNLEKPAGDEGTNGGIHYYNDRLGELGRPHSFVYATGKTDMTARPGATGKHGAASLRTTMAFLGIERLTVAQQGAGFAGGYFGAEAYDPEDETDRQFEIVISALGDLGVNGRPQTLVTDHPDGLVFTKKMMDSILLHGSQDDDMRATGGVKLLALARKNEAMGRNVQIEDKDVLTYNRARCRVPAATSNVITPEVLRMIEAYKGEYALVHAIANNAFTPEALALVETSRRIKHMPTEAASSGGVGMSLEERRRDLARIVAIENNKKFTPETDAIYDARVRTRVVRATHQTLEIADKYDVTWNQAIRIVNLGNRAVARGIKIDGDIESLLAA